MTGMRRRVSENVFRIFCCVLAARCASVASVAAGASPRVETVDASSLHGKLLCSYQGWFACEGDGSGLGWVHWSRRGQPRPGDVTVDLWPDLSDLPAEERFQTGFRLADGRPAEVFSSFKEPTVLRHFQWMQEYGIDGAFVQRFANGLRRPGLLHHKDAVLQHSRTGAQQSGRVYAVMYDLSGLRAGQIDVVIEDWRRLHDELRITDDARYLHHKGKPLVAVWGVGFSDGRSYTLDECRRLVEFFKSETESGGCSVMLGIPTWWREQKRDAVSDPELHEVLRLADVLSPWTVGRIRTPDDARRHGREVWRPDLAWCRDRKLDYLPVVFPGFSWHNLKGGELGQIPRRGGRFLWAQLVAARRAGAQMVYVAMFDEVDEGTAIFKCTNDVPVGDSAHFLTLNGLPSDHYLRLAGRGRQLFRDEIPATDAMPDLDDAGPDSSGSTRIVPSRSRPAR